MEPRLIVMLNRPVKAGAVGVYGMDNKPLAHDAPAGRRVYMAQKAAIAATLAGNVDMLSPLGVGLVEKARTKMEADAAAKAKKKEAAADDAD